MDELLAFAYQEDLIFLGLDDQAPFGILPRVSGGLSGDKISQWRQEVICFLYKNLVSELIRADDFSGKCREMSPVEICQFLEKTEIFDISMSTEWVATFFVGTDKLVSLLQKHQLHGWDHYHDPLNEVFMAEVLKIYEEFGV